MENQNCLKCNKLLEGRKDKKYCDSKCRTRYGAFQHYLENKDKPEYRKYKKEMFHNWYQKPENKIKQFNHVMNDYKKHKDRWRLRSFINNHREKIFLFINKECAVCSKPIKILHPLNYTYPKLDLEYKLQKEKNLNIIKKYVEENIRGVCSRECGYKLKLKAFRN